jgi:hypothetical protein
MLSCILALVLHTCCDFSGKWDVGIGWDVLFMLSWIRGRAKHVWIVGILQDGREGEHVGYLTHA